MPASPQGHHTLSTRVRPWGGPGLAQALRLELAQRLGRCQEGDRPATVGSVVRRTLLLAGGLAATVAAAAAPGSAWAAARRNWSPFVLVAGLLLVGLVAHADGLFDRAAEATGRLRGGGVALFLALLGLVAVVSAALNLDTSVTFLTPVLVLSARRRGLDVTPFVLGSLCMANAASLLLPGSNLTNLLVLAREHVSGGAFAARMLPAWAAAVSATAVILGVRFRHALTAGEVRIGRASPSRSGCVGAVATAAAAAAAAVLALRSAALPVLGVGLAAVGVRVRQRRLSAAAVVAAVDLVVLGGLFGLAVALGALGAAWSAPATLMASTGRWQSAAIGAVAAVAVNNLPAAVLLSTRVPSHPRALLIGLDLGPNLAVTGSLSALLWFQAARAVGARPSLAAVTRIGLVLVPSSIVAALVASTAFAPGRL